MRVKVKKRSLKALLDEGVLDNLIGALENYESRLASDFSKFMKQGGRKDALLPLGFKKDGSNITKLQAASVTAVILGSAVQEADTATGNISTAMTNALAAADSDSPEEFVKAVAQLYKTMGEELSSPMGWLNHKDLESASRQFYKISQGLSADSVPEIIENLAKSFKEIDSLNIAKEISNMFNNPAAKEIIEKDAANNGDLSPLVDKAKDKLPYLKIAGDIAVYLSQIPAKLKEIDEMVAAKSEQPKNAEDKQIDSAMFESFVLKVVRSTIRKSEKV